MQGSALSNATIVATHLLVSAVPLDLPLGLISCGFGAEDPLSIAMLQVALGSSIQIAVFVVPVVVLVGWCINKQLTLAMDPFLVTMFVLAVIHASMTSSDGQSNYLAGIQLVGNYLLIGLTVIFV